MLKRGIVMIAMGAEYERLAAATIRYSMQNTLLPFAVIFNTEYPEGNWDNLNVIRIVDECDTNLNRIVKTQLYKYTPFQETLYMDVDAVIQLPGIERVFDGLASAPIVFQRHTVWHKFRRYYDIYRRAMKKFDCQLPTDIMIGGFFAFKKDIRVEMFFDLWREYWEEFGCGRDMPPLACAVKNSGLPHNHITATGDKIFSFGYRPDSIAVHRIAGDDLETKFGIQKHKQNKPFDIGHKSDWDLVYFDGIQNEWLKKKADIAKQDIRERKYISTYLSDLRLGCNKVLDLGCGFGQFLLVCRRYGNNVFGIVPPLEKYESKRGLSNSDSLDYEMFCRERLAKIKVPFVECDLESVIFDNKPLPVEGVYNYVNCKHAINLILRTCFDFKGDLKNYKNNGSWIIDEVFIKAFERLLSVVHAVLMDKGTFFIASLNSTNSAKYSEVISGIAERMGFTVESYRDGHNHRFTKVV